MQLKYILLLGCYVQYGFASDIIPSTLFGFKIKEQHNINNIINNLENRIPDLIPFLAERLLQNRDNSTLVFLSIVYENLGGSSNKLFEFVKMINACACKSSIDPVKLTNFISDRYEWYTDKKQNGYDRLDYYLKAYEDAKILFYYGRSVLNKVFNNQPIVQSEERFIRNNNNLLTWASRNGYISELPSEKYSVISNMRQAGLFFAPHMPILGIFMPSSDVLLLLSGLLYVQGDNMLLASELMIVKLMFEFAFFSGLYALHTPFDTTVLFNRYFSHDDQIVSLEEMDNIIENAN